MDNYLTIPEVAERIKCSETTVRRAIDSGELPAKQFRRLWRVKESNLEKYMTPQSKVG